MIHEIGTLTAINFFKILETNNKYILLKKRLPFLWMDKLKVKLFKLDLEKSWEEIKEGYSDSEDSLKVKKINELKNRYEKLNSKYQTIIVCLEVLKRGRDGEMLAILKKYGYEIKGNYKDGLLGVYKQVENLKNKIDYISSELEKYLEVGDDKKISIYEIIVNLIVGLGLSLKANEITVSEFIYYKKSLANKIKQQQKQQKK